MTYEKIFERADRLYPSEYGAEEYKEWCREVDLEVIRNVKCESISSKESEQDEETLIDEPYSDVYLYHIMSQIALWQRDYTAYGVHKGLYDARMEEYKAWHIRTYGTKVQKFKNWL